MFKSFAYVGLLASLVMVANSATAQTDGQPTTTTVNNHISDAERDRLMQEAMDKARRELEKTKAEREAGERVKAERDALARREAAARAEAEKEAQRKKAEAQAAKKAEEERLARELAEAEKQSSEKARATKSDDVKDLDAAPTRSEPATSERKTASSSRSEGSSSKKSSESEKSESTSEDTEVVVETAATRDPSSPITVKTSMPVGDGAREAEQRAARQSASSGGSARSDSGGDSNSFAGQVVGIMRTSERQARILVQADDRRMIQVVLDDTDVPAPGSRVSFSGRTIGGDHNSPVVSARSVSIQSGQALEPIGEIAMPPAAPVIEVPPAIPPHAPMMPPPGVPMMPPPMPMGIGPMGPMGPGPMIAGPPPF